MVQRAPFSIDPADPRAPTQAEWDAMGPDERARVIAMLPAEIPFELAPPEGDLHRKAKSKSVDALDRFFRKMGRRVYLSSELAVYYPGESRFAPDVLAVCDVDPRDRMKWIVSDEGRGLDFVLEVHLRGDEAKDHRRNVARYARLGIPEYFLLDLATQQLRGFRLPDANARAYDPVLPQQGRFASCVLGLELALEGGRLRFFSGTAPLDDADELIGRLGTMVDELLEKRQQSERRAELEAERAAAEAQRAEAEAKRADDAERRLAEALAELERLRRSR